MAFPIVLSAMGSGPVAMAAGECGLLTADEVSAAFGVKGTELAGGDETACVFTGPASVMVTVTPGAALAQARSDHPDGRAVEVAGEPGWSAPDAGALFVAADGALLGLQVTLEQGAAVDDVEAALTQLAERALPRLPAGPDTADLDRLRALMPEEIDGVRLRVQTTSGDQLLSFVGPEDPRAKALTDALAAQGRTFADITLMGGSPEGSRSDAGAAAFLIAGADAAALLEPIVTLLLTNGSDAAMSTVDLGGKQVTRIDGDPVLHAYATGDIIVVVSGPDDFLASYFASLP